jgi:hypothetical protein
MVTTHQFSSDGRHLARCIGRATREEQALPNVVAIVANESGLKSGQHLPLRDFRAAFLQLESDFDSNSCDEITVLWRENIVGITASHEEVGKRFTNEISEYRGIGSGVRRATEPGNGYGFAPVKARLGVGRGRDCVFKCNVFLEEREFGFHIYRSGLWGEVNKNA